MSLKENFNIIFSNVRGLGSLCTNQIGHRTNRISHKIQELDFSSQGIPSLYCLLETKLPADKNIPKLPRHLKFVGQTANKKGGILIYIHNSLEFDNFKVIYSKYAVYVKIKIGTTFIENIIVYLPCELKECLAVLHQIELFIQENSIENFCFYGDFNISDTSPHHLTKAKRLNRILNRFNLFDLSEKLNYNHDYTWCAIRNGKFHSSKIDHFYCNINMFNSIKFQHNSFSDHKHCTVSFRKSFVYCPPSWKSHLFKKTDFVEHLKKETISFLYDLSEIQHLQNTKEVYVTNPNLFDNEVSFDHLEYKETSAFFDLLTHLKKAHDKFFSKDKAKNSIKLKSFDDEISKLYKCMKNQPNIDTVEQIQKLVSSQQEYFKSLVYSQAEFKYFRRLQYDGGYNNMTFRHIPNFKKTSYKINTNGETVTSPQKLANLFANQHAKIISPECVPKSTLNNLLNDYDLNMEKIFPRIKNLTSPYSTTKQFREIINSMKNTSAPGISSQPKALFLFLLDLLPTFFTKALNKLYDIDIDNSPFRWIKDRNVIFIPKKNFDLTLIEHFRAIVLLEIVYKILSKALNRKLTSYLDRIVHSGQFAYVPTRLMSNASINLTAEINHMEKAQSNCQIISFDFSKAFDMVLEEVFNVILSFIFPEGNFAHCFINFTNRGRFRVAVNGYFSKWFKIKRGSSQGDSPSGSKFIIVNHIFIACLESTKIKHIYYKIGPTPVRPKSFADDTIISTILKENKDVLELINLLSKLENSIGLQINFDKTKILVQGSYPSELSKLGQIVEYFKHLGIYISFNQTLAKEMTYNELCYKLEKKAKRFPLKPGYNLLKRRNLCSALLSSSAYHIYRVYNPDEKTLQRLQKIVLQFLWSQRKEDGTITSRTKIARPRIELDLRRGGLNLLLPKSQSFSIWINSFMSCLKYASDHPDTSIGLIFTHKHMPIKSLLKTFSFLTLTKYQKTFKELYPCKGGDYFEKALEFFYNLEHDKSTCLFSPILTSNFANITTPFTKNDKHILSNAKKFTIASILECKKIGAKALYLPILDLNIHESIHDLILINKLQKVVDAFKPCFSATSFSLQKSKLFLNPLSSLLVKNKKLFSFHFKQMYKSKIDIELPSIMTRKRDKLFFPDKELFELTIKKLFNLPIILHFKNFYLEQLNRTLPSKNKLFKFKLVDSNICNKCNTESNTDHALFFCIFPSYFIHKLAVFLDIKYNNGQPQFIFLKESFYLFNMYYDDFSLNVYTQLSNLILAAKDKSLKLSKEDCISNWNKNNLHAHTILLTQFSFKLLQNAGQETNFISDFLEFLITQ